MSRLIYADVLIENLRNDITGKNLIRLYNLDGFINAQPTVDAVEVVHAKLLNPNPYGLCSNCNYLIDIRDGFNYCPKCGAMLKTNEVTE